MILTKSIFLTFFHKFSDEGKISPCRIQWPAVFICIYFTVYPFAPFSPMSWHGYISVFVIVLNEAAAVWKCFYFFSAQHARTSSVIQGSVLSPQSYDSQINCCEFYLRSSAFYGEISDLIVNLPGPLRKFKSAWGCWHSWGDRCGQEWGAKVPALVDTLRWRTVHQEILVSWPVSLCPL